MDQHVAEKRPRGRPRKTVQDRGDGNRRVFMVVHAGISQKLIATESVLDGDMGFCGEVLCDKTAVAETVDTIALEHPECGQCGEDGFRVVSAFQIKAHGKVLGFFNLQFRRERIFTSAEKRLIETLGQHLGVAIEAQDIKQREREVAILQERNLVAQGLHDSIAQGLNFLNLQVQMLEDSLARRDWAQMEDITPLLRAGVRESYDDVRELLNNFRVKLGSLDLAEALALTIDKFQRQSQTPVEFIQHGQGHLRAPEQQLQIVFILQEALSNIRKHAKAERVTVTLVNDHDLTLTIADNGVGFDLEQVASEKDGHIGLNIMRERAARLGGSLSLHAVRGEGTQIVLSIANVAAMPAVVRTYAPLAGIVSESTQLGALVQCQYGVGAERTETHGRDVQDRCGVGLPAFVSTDLDAKCGRITRGHRTV